MVIQWGQNRTKALVLPDDDDSDDDIDFGDHLYIIGRFCLCVCLSRKMITLPNSLKSSSLAVAVPVFKHCNKKCSL